MGERRPAAMCDSRRQEVPAGTATLETMTSPGTPGGTPERPAIFFADADEFGAWLAAHHDTAPELWMGLHKKHVPTAG